MSANLRILKGLEDAFQSITIQRPELRFIHAPLKKRVDDLGKLKEDLERKKAVLKYTIEDLDKDAKAYIRLPVVKYYLSKNMTMHRTVLLFLQGVKKQIKDRYDGAATCARPESVSEWNLDALAGLEDEKTAVRDAWIRPNRFPSLYRAGTRGILFYGPPGTGKTVLAKAMSNALPKVAFFSVDASTLKSKWLGATEKLIAAKFNCASDIIEEEPEKYESSIVFIDEIDSIAVDRSKAESGSASTASTQALLVAMDGFFSSKKVAVLGATNTPWNLDEGVLRRFDERIFLDLPTLAARIGIILDSIVKYFAPPWIRDKKEHTWTNGVPKTPNAAKDEKTIYDAMLNTTNYAGASEATWGAFNSLSEGDVRIFIVNGVPQPPEKILNSTTIRDILLEIAQLMGPRPSEKDKMTGRTDPLEYHSKAVSRFGYNASDISKVIKKASTIAASKTLYDPDIGGAYWRPIPNEVYPDNTPAAEKKYYYSVFPKVMNEQLDAPLEIAINRAGRDGLINFTLSREDIIQAMNQIGSSVREENYLELLKFRKTG